MLAGHLALALAALFSGAALFITIGEHPARLRLDDGPLLAQWKPSYARGYAMQASLAVAGFLLGLLAWWGTGRPAFLVGGLLLVANWPWTKIAMLPTNKALMATDPASAGPQSRAMLVRWGRLHTVRTALGLAATGSLLVALS